MPQVHRVLETIVQNRELHARFLNSLSYLEYRGARKIIRALGTEDIDDEVLTHAMEEMGHALYFKKLALKVGGPEFNSYRGSNMLAEDAIKSYFYELDKNVDALLTNVPRMSASAKKRVYYFVTWLIEERAVKVYREYQKLLQAKGENITLKPILVDEAGHLADMQLQIREQAGVDVGSLVALEAKLFTHTWQALESSL